jgi:16S rRNA (adenine1518-N6/adenine1519-N6)-dimethyltransferase
MPNFEQTTLADLTIVRQITNLLGGGTKKSFGQNFLVNQNSLLKFIDLIHIEENDVIVEIGPGIGVVSYTLCQRANNVYLIEIDREKEKALDKTLENFSNYEILWEDATRVNWLELYKKIQNDLGSEKQFNLKVIGSLPYNAAKKIIYNFLTSGVQWKEAAFFVQREVADNYTSEPPKAEFLTNFAQVYSDIKFAFGIPSEHFYPQPKVKTGVIHLTRSDKFSHLDREKFGKFIRHGFVQPRKTLSNNLKSLGITQEVLKQLGIKESARPSELSMNDWEKLYTEYRNSADT